MTISFFKFNSASIGTSAFRFLDVVPSCRTNRRGLRGLNSLRPGTYQPLRDVDKCMQISKHRDVAKPMRSKVVRLAA
jgi:hypothetical protein